MIFMGRFIAYCKTSEGLAIKRGIYFNKCPGFFFSNLMIKPLLHKDS